MVETPTPILTFPLKGKGLSRMCFRQHFLSPLNNYYAVTIYRARLFFLPLKSTVAPPLIIAFSTGSKNEVVFSTRVS